MIRYKVRVVRVFSEEDEAVILDGADDFRVRHTAELEIAESISPAPHVELADQGDFEDGELQGGVPSSLRCWGTDNPFAVGDEFIVTIDSA
jgi:hypothetical protein